MWVKRCLWIWSWSDAGSIDAPQASPSTHAPRLLILSWASSFLPGLGHLAQAEEYLSQAQWIVLKKSHQNDAIQSKLHRNLGLLFAAKGNYEESLFHLANDVRLSGSEGTPCPLWFCCLKGMPLFLALNHLRPCRV